MQIFFNELDKALFLILNQCHHPIFDHFFRHITTVYFWVPLYIFLFFFIKNRLGWPGVLFFTATIVISDQFSASVCKPFFAKYRPCYQIDISLLHLVGDHEGLYGFPSSHASNTFSFSMTFWKTFKPKYRYAFLFFIWATIISYGRIYGGMHYPLDILCGAILGIGIGILSHQFYKRSRWWKHDVTSKIT